MNRPRYETQADRDNEQRVVDYLATLGWQFEKIPMQYRMDFAIFRDGECRGFAELKSRNVFMNTYPSVMISLSKVLAARWLTEATGLPAYLVVRYQDALTRLDFSDYYELRMGGRADRGDPQDRDICAYYPTERLRLISQK